MIEPGEFAAKLDQGPTVALRDDVLAVSPIVFCDEAELLPREQAAAELGLDPGRTNALIQLGEVPQRQRDFMIEAWASQILQDQGTQVAILQSATCNKLQLPPAVAKLAATYPIARRYLAFDFVISAAGYNSFHELVGFGVPDGLLPRRAEDDRRPGCQGALRGADWGRRRDRTGDLPRRSRSSLNDCERGRMTLRAG